MGFDAIIQKTWQENILYSVLLELSYRCNLDCFFCYNDRELAGDALTTEQYLSLLQDLRDLQVMNLVLSGGEPLVHPDFFTIGGRARELGFVTRVKTNGHSLRGRLARRLEAEVTPFLVDISLHGATAPTHDRQTRVAGSFDRLMVNVPELLDLGLRLRFNCTLTTINEHEVEALFELADSLGIDLEFNTSVSPRDDGDTEPLRIAPSREARRRLFRVQLERAGTPEIAPAADRELGDAVPDAGKSCGVGSATLTVDPVGNVLPCVQWRQPVGNLHRQSVREIWESSLALRRVRRTAQEARRLIDGFGPAGRRMGFCPALAAARTGDPLTVYPEAREQMELIGELENDREDREAAR
jgi:MoaA/NifB/PqqE/SkfB family radical SAM enzyme